MVRQTRRGAAAAAAAADSFSSPASHSNVKLSSFFIHPPKLPPSNSRNPRKLSSLFTVPAETTSSHPENSPEESKAGVLTARRLQKFLQTKCNSGDVSAEEAFHFFHRMIQSEPRLANQVPLLRSLRKMESQSASTNGPLFVIEP